MAKLATKWRRTWRAPAFCFGIVGTLYACGSPNEQALFAPKLPDASANEDSKGRPVINLGGNGSDSTTVVIEDGDGAVCAGTSQQAQRLPLHLVVLFDKSSSMCQYDPADPTASKRDCSRAESRWQVSASALRSFFASPETAGIVVSAIAFPKRATPGDSLATRQSKVCLSNYYNGIDGDDTDGIADRELSAIALPSATAADGLLATPPMQSGMITPTRFAAHGGIELAKTIASSGTKTVVVLFTDGLPGWCETDSSTPDSSGAVNAELAAGLGQGIRTYVVGIVASGDVDYTQLRTSLNGFAAAGGSGSANIVEISNPAASTAAILDAMNNIRTQAASCDFAMPKSNGAGTVDPKKVNLLYTPGVGAARSLAQSADCSDASGWRYNDPAVPTRIQLCAQACSALQADNKARVDIVLGCVTGGVN